MVYPSGNGVAGDRPRERLGVLFCAGFGEIAFVGEGDQIWQDNVAHCGDYVPRRVDNPPTVIHCLGRRNQINKSHASAISEVNI